MWVVLERTRWGYEIRSSATTRGRRATRASTSPAIMVVLVSAAPGGHRGHGRGGGCRPPAAGRISPGYGFTAIIIAYLAEFGPFGVIFASILFGGLILAGREIHPSGRPAMMQGIVLMCLSAPTP